MAAIPAAEANQSKPALRRPRRPLKERLTRSGQSSAVLLALVVLLAVMLSPFAIIALNALKSAEDYASNGPLSWPQSLSLDGVIDFWNRVDFTGKLINSIVISLSVAIFSTVLSLLNAFALGIGKIRGALWFLIFFMLANMLPNEAIVYPLYYMAKEVNLYNTQLAVIIIFIVIQSAFGTYFLSSVLRAFPRELLDAARVDGCNKVQLLVQVVAPIVRPSLAVFMVFSFIWTWNELYLPLVFLIDNSSQTVPLAVATLYGQHNMDATQVAASALLGVLPCVVFFLLFQRTLTRGITAGSYK
jgi:raffinose/stachyose/melibiose transport system permease protein